MRLLQRQLVLCYGQPPWGSPGAFQDNCFEVTRTGKHLKESTCAGHELPGITFGSFWIFHVLHQKLREPSHPAWPTTPAKQFGNLLFVLQWICHRVHVSKQVFVRACSWTSLAAMILHMWGASGRNRNPEIGSGRWIESSPDCSNSVCWSHAGWPRMISPLQPGLTNGRLHVNTWKVLRVSLPDDLSAVRKTKDLLHTDWKTMYCPQPALL